MSSLGIYRILIIDTNSTTPTPLPDGVVAYLSFSVNQTTSAAEALAVSSYSATDLKAAALTVNAATNGAVNVVTKPGNSWGGGAESLVTLVDVQNALYMLLDPVTYPVSGSIDLNADGIVQIYELQQVINSFLGL